MLLFRNIKNGWRAGLLLLFWITACEVFEPAAPADEEILDGPLDGLTHSENLRFLRGDIAFNDDIFSPATGLGPLFVATSCGSCHPGDGKGHPFTTLTRFGQTDETGNQYLGPQPLRSSARRASRRLLQRDRMAAWF